MKTTYLLFTEAMATWLRDARGQMNVSQTKAATGIGIHQVMLSSMERGSPKKVSTKNWAKAVRFYAKKGITPFVESEVKEAAAPVVEAAIDPKAVAKELKRLKAESKSSWVMIAETMGIHAQTLMTFIRTGELGTKSLGKLREGLDRLNGLEQKLVAQGSLEPAKEVKHAKAPKVVAKKQAKPSLIQHASNEIPALTLLASAKFMAAKELLKAATELENYLSSPAGIAQNGKGHALVRS